MLLLKKIFKKYSLFTILKGLTLLINLIILRIMRLTFNDDNLADSYEIIALGLTIATLIDFGKSKKALINGGGDKAELMQYLLMLIGLILVFYINLSLISILIAYLGALSMYLKSACIHKSNYFQWFMLEIMLSTIMGFALFFHLFLGEDFFFIWGVLLIVGYIWINILYFKTVKTFIFFSGSFALMLDSLIYQLISLLFFKINITPILQVYFSRLFNMSKAAVSIYSSVNLSKMAQMKFHQLASFALISTIAPIGIIYIILGELMIGNYAIYFFIYVSNLSILFSMKYLMLNKHNLKLIFSLTLLTYLICIGYILY